MFLKICHKNITKIYGMSRPSFFFSEKKKKSAKVKKNLPTMSTKESSLIPIVKNLNRSTNIITANAEYTIDPQIKIEETTLY
jgi:hypothetical protein